MDTYQSERLLLWCHVFLPLLGKELLFLRQEYCGCLPFHSSVDHVLLELSTMTHLSWVALHSMVATILERVCWHKSFLEVTFSPSKEPVDSRTGSTKDRELIGREHSPTHNQKIGLKIHWPCLPKQDPVFPTASLLIRKCVKAFYPHPSKS